MVGAYERPIVLVDDYGILTMKKFICDLSKKKLEPQPINLSFLVN